MQGTTIRDSVLARLRAVLSEEPGILVIHSSISMLAPPPSLSPWDVLYAIGTLMREGWTIAVPAFTFSFCRGETFVRENAPSETGILADWLLAHFPEAVRTDHPIYSFAVIGPQAERVAACYSPTTFGDGSPFELFEKENADIVMFGCGWKYCTPFHRYEELAGVSYRYYKEFSGKTVVDGAERAASARMFVRDHEINAVNDFTPAVSRLREQGLIRQSALWRGDVEATCAGDLARVAREMLSEDPLAFVANRDAVAHRLDQRSEAERQSPLRIAVLGSANVEILKSALEANLAELLPARRVEVHTVPYGQLAQELIDPQSELRQFSAQISFFCDRPEDLLGQDELHPSDAEIARERVREHASMVAEYSRATGGWTVVHSFAVMSQHDTPTGTTVAALVQELNGAMRDALDGLDQLAWLDIAGEAAVSATPPVDLRLWYIGRFPYSDAFSQSLARRWAGMALAILGKTARLVAIDLDNTIWGGVLGEDGTDGIKVGGDYPGNAFLALQRAVKDLTERGIVLAVCSKNDEDLALKALDTLPAMAVRSSDLVAHRINWEPKWINLRGLAEELNLGLESVMFIDDNPVEREAVRRNLPGVKVLELPPDPAEYATALKQSPWLGMLTVTSEDRNRVEGYKARSQIQRERRNAASLEDFYAKLDMKLHFQPLADGNIARAAQLCQKTNQFNTTTRRYEQRDLRGIVEAGGDVVVVGLEDRYSAFDNIGLLIMMRHPEASPIGIVDNYLLSCRVLGRGIESAVLNWAVGRAARHGWSELRGMIVETPRNTPVRGVFRDAGFMSADGSGEWCISTKQPPSLPAWFTVLDGFAAVQELAS